MRHKENKEPSYR